MKNSEKKRYLVTYQEGGVSMENASAMLGLPTQSMLDGLEFMATDSIASDADVLHFESLGVSSIALSESDVEAISHMEGVLAVEEDVEMHAIEKDFEVVEEGEDAPFVQQWASGMADQSGANYAEGYDQALLDIFASMLRLKRTQPDSAEELEIEAFASQPIPWNISMVKAPYAWRRGITGRGVKVAILDTGIAAHPDLAIYGGVSFVPGVTSYNDGHGHGTHCAGVVAARNNSLGVVGVAPDARLYAVKVLSDGGSGNSSWIIAGMEWCVKNGMKVASMSLGGTNAPFVAYANAVKRCQDNGVTVVVAAGNSFGSSFPYVCAPANSVLVGQPNASPLAVGAIDSRSVIAPFSSRGGATSVWNQVTSVAPGVNIRSTYKGGGYATLQGTSMACPHVAGYVALLVQRFPGISTAQIKAKIRTTSRGLGPIGYDKTYGYGLIDCDKATR